MIALVLLCVGGGCAKSATVDDPEVKPLLAAMKVVDRATLGFSAIEESVQMMLEGVPEPIPSDDGPPALLLFFMFIFACVLALAGGAIAALTLLVMAALLAGLIAAGVVSASVVIGVLRRSVSTGFRALFFQIGGVLGLILGSLGAWIFILLAKLPMDSVQPWVIGPLVGVVFGLLAAWMFNFAWGRSVEWIARKLPGRRTVEVETEKVVSGESSNQ